MCIRDRHCMVVTNCFIVFPSLSPFRVLKKQPVGCHFLMLYVSTYSRQYMAVNSNGKHRHLYLRSSPLVSGNAYDFRHCLSVLLHLLPIHRFHARYICCSLHLRLYHVQCCVYDLRHFLLLSLIHIFCRSDSDCL